MDNMTKGSIRIHLLSYAIPLIFGNMFQLTYNAVDSMIIAHFADKEALAAVSSSNPVMTIIVLGASGMAIGASVIMSNYFGAGRIDDLKKEAATLLTFGVILSIVVFAAGLIWSTEILSLMNVPKEIIGSASIYLRIIFFSFPFVFLYNILSQAMRSTGDSKTPVYFLAASSILNAILDLLFVCVFHWSSAGAGAATAIAETLSAMLCFIYVKNHVPILRIKLRDWKIDRVLLRKTLSLGTVTALQQSCQPIGKAIIQSVINAQGINVIGAFNAVIRVEDFACIPEQSISHSMMTCAAQNIGAQKESRVLDTLLTGLKLEIIYGIVVGIVVWLIKHPVMLLFADSEESEIVHLGVSYLRIMAYFYILPAITNAMQGFFRGTGHMKITLICTILQISLRVIFIKVSVPIIGMNGGSYACAAGWSAMLLLQISYYFIAIKRPR